MDDPRYILFLALTRPAINRWGIPHKAFILIFAGTIVFGMWVGHGTGWHQPFYYLIAVPLFYGVRLLTEWDHNFLRIIQLWFQTKGQGLGKRRGSVLTPLPAGVPRNARDIPGAV